jgi:16S rRNA (guanine527-N7)-methyltransferase
MYILKEKGLAMEEKNVLIEGSKELGIHLEERQIEQLFAYKALLLEWNQKMNLTAITDDLEVITKHFLDCMTVQKAFPMKDVKTLIDVGTGAGFPGLVIKIVFPWIEVTLVDSLNKRLNFLKEVISALGLKGVECVHARAEDLGQNKSYRENFDICASRAVANLAVLAEYTLPFVKEGGYLIALKGQKVEDEIEGAKKALTLLGGKLIEVVDAKVPMTDLEHKIATIKKVKKTPKAYPRKAGEPTKAPLGK